MEHRGAILKALVADTDKYQHAAGASKILDNQAIGVSRGGKTTKIHALVTENFLPTRSSILRETVGRDNPKSFASAA